MRGEAVRGGRDGGPDPAGAERPGQLVLLQVRLCPARHGDTNFEGGHITPGGWCQVSGRGWDTGAVNPGDRLRSVGRRMADPAEVLAQQITDRVVELVVNALDVNELVTRVDLNAVIGAVDIDAVLTKIDLNTLVDRLDLDDLIRRVDVGAVLDRVDVNDLVKRIDMAALVEETDLGAVIARSSGGVVNEALDALRSQAVGLDRFIDRWVSRLLRRKHPLPSAPSTLLPGKAET